MKKFRIIFMGTPDFALPALQCLIDSNDDVVALVTQPDRPKGRSKKLVPPPTKILAQKANIPVLQPTKIKTEEFLQEIKALKPDLIVVVAYGRILPASILSAAPLGAINIHGSLLPKYRGAAPIQWAVINGDEQAGVTVMQMDEGMDTGDILLSESIAVAKNETGGSLFTKLSNLGGTALLKAMTGLHDKTLVATSQDDSLASPCPMLSKNDGLLDWNKSAKELHCLIRGLDPWPTAFSFLNGKRFRFFSPEIIYKNSNNKPGTVVNADKTGVLLATGKNLLLIKEIQPEGKKRMSAAAFLCGYTFEPESIFTDPE